MADPKHPSVDSTLPMRMEPGFFRAALIELLGKHMTKPLTAQDLAWFDDAIDRYADIKIKEYLVLNGLAKPEDVGVAFEDGKVWVY